MNKWLMFLLGYIFGGFMYQHKMFVREIYEMLNTIDVWLAKMYIGIKD